MNTFRKIYALLSKQERRQVYWILPVITLMALLQVVGIASVAPFMALVAKPDMITTNEYLSRAYTTFGFTDPRNFLIASGIGALLVILFTNMFAAYTTWLIYKFSWDTYHSLSERTLVNYLYKPYSFYLNRNTADLGKNILSEVSDTVRQVLVPTMNLISRSVVATFVLLTLVIINPLLALIMFGLIGGAYGIIFYLVRRKLSAYGEAKVKANRERFHSVLEALSGVKEVKLLGKEPVFIRRYSKPSRKYAHVTAANQVISQLPSYGLEALAFGGVLLMVVYLLSQGQDVTSILPTLTVYVFAIYRLMPALQNIFSSVTSIRSNEASLNTVYRDMQSSDVPEIIDRDTIPTLPFKDRLELKNITFTYPNMEQPVLADFNISIRANTSVAFVGSTGSGKTTTVDLLLGLLSPEKGSLVVDGVPITDKNTPNWMKNLGYVPQVIYLTDDTIERNIAFGVHHTKVDRAAVEQAAKLANIHDFVVNDLPQGYDTAVGERGVRLSGGQRQRLGIARALYHNPEVLILDEATSALDGVTEENIFQAVDNIGKSKTIVMIAHRISTVRNCDVIYLLDHGRVLAKGSYDELIASSPEFRAIAQVAPVPVA
ncbi:ABC transporter ATP-binding protein [soil metagenome]